MTDIQIITTNGKKMALVPLTDYNRMVKAIEHKEDILDVREASAILERLMNGTESVIPSEVANAILDGTAPLRAWRNYRGMTAEALSKKVGISRAYLTQIEHGTRAGRIEVLQIIAKTLETGIDAIVD